MRLFVIRHAQTEYNSRKLIQGKIDSTLTELGKSQAEGLAEELKNILIDNIFSSPMLRTYTTALSIATPHRLPVVKTPSLLERNYGIYEGKPMPETKMAHPEYFSDYPKLDYNVKPPEGESINEVYRRVNGFVEKLKVNLPERTIVLVAHGIVNKIIVSSLIDGNLKKMGTYKQKNACINELEIVNGKAKAIRLNYTDHLTSE